MKKIASVVLAVLVVFSMFTFMATAADSVSVTVSADKTNVKVGDVVTVVLSVSENSDLCSFTANLEYDASVFEVVPNVFGEDRDKSYEVYKEFGMEVVNDAFSRGMVKFTGATMAEGITGSKLMTMKFKAIAAGEAKFGVSVEEAKIPAGEDGYGAQDVATTTNSIKVTVEAEEVPTDPTEHTHDYAKAIVTKEATCDKEGLQVQKCKICDHELEEVIPAKGHKAGKWEVKTPATASKEGVKVQKCTECGKTLKTAAIPKLQDSITTPVIPNTDAIA